MTLDTSLGSLIYDIGESQDGGSPTLLARYNTLDRTESVGNAVSDLLLACLTDYVDDERDTLAHLDYAIHQLKRARLVVLERIDAP